MSEIEETPAIEVAEKEELKRLTTAQWTEICTRYELGETKAKDLSTEFGISGSALHAYFKRHGIKAGSKKHVVAAAVTSAVTAAITGPGSFTDQRKTRIEDAKKQALEDVLLIRSWARKTVADSLKAIPPKAPASIYHDLKAIRMASAIFTQNRQERYSILEIAHDIDEDELPTLEIEDLSSKEITELQSKSDDEDPDSIDLADIDFSDGDDEPEAEASEVVLEEDED